MPPHRSRRVIQRATRYGVLSASLTALLLAGSPGASAGGGSLAPHLVGNAAVGDETSATTSAPVGPTTQAEVRPRLRPLTRPLGQVADGPVPAPTELTKEISDEVASRWLGPSKRRALTVRDALTGEHLADRNADKLVVPASTTKVLSAAAIVTGLSPEQTFRTSVVSGATPEEVVLVAGGDMMLARGEGSEDAVAGHAGVLDLARQAAEGLRDAPEPVTVQLDLDHVAGPAVLDSWTADWVDYGYTGRIVQLGLAEDLAAPFAPSPKDPPQEVAAAFREALAGQGIKVVDADDPKAKAEVVSAAQDATEIAAVESAPMRDVLAHALATSDNAMVEQLARQAAVAAGQGVARKEVTQWVKDSIEEKYGIDLTDVQLADTSGLSDGTRIPVRAIADVLVAGSNGSHPGFQDVLAAGGLPIAGYTGTLASRFHLPVHAAAVGNARAKTGSLPHVTSLAGTVVTRDGRLLVYAMTADKIGEDGAVLEARSVLDEIVAQLARCGC